METLKIPFMVAFSGVESENEILRVPEKVTINIVIVSGCTEAKTGVHGNSDSRCKEKHLPQSI